MVANKARVGLLSLVLLGWLAACQAPPDLSAPRTFVNAQTLDGDFDATWGRVIQWISMEGIQPATLDKPSGLVIYNISWFFWDTSKYADCGSTFALGDVRLNGRVSILVTRAAPAQTRVTVNTAWTFYNDVGGFWACRSNGSVEQAVLSGVQGT